MQIDKSAIETLELQWSPADTRGPSRLPLRSVELLPALYQARPGYTGKSGVVDRAHVAGLAAHLRTPGSDTDPITVLRVGKRNILVDGHHRLAAYKAQKRPDIPVQWFQGSPKQALVESGRENAKSRLPMTNADRQERAWALVCSGLTLSKAEIASGAGICKSQVAIMRRALKPLLEAGQDVPQSWRLLRNAQWLDLNEYGESKKANEVVAKWVSLLNASVGPSGTFRTAGKLNLLAQALHEWGPNAMEHVVMVLVEEYGLQDKVVSLLGSEAESLREEILELRREAAGLSEF